MTQKPSLLVHQKVSLWPSTAWRLHPEGGKSIEKGTGKHQVPIYLIEIEVPPKKDIPAFCPYKPNNRYWKEKTLGFLKQQNQESDFVTIGLTHRDISTSIHRNYKYGIVGLSFRPGKACVVSTFRLKRKDDLWKVTTHEFLHSPGLPMAKRIIQSAWYRMPMARILSTCKTSVPRLPKLIEKHHWQTMRDQNNQHFTYNFVANV